MLGYYGRKSFIYKSLLVYSGKSIDGSPKVFFFTVLKAKSIVAFCNFHFTDLYSILF
jgi:hypothetical protein